MLQEKPDGRAWPRRSRPNLLDTHSNPAGRERARRERQEMKVEFLTPGYRDLQPCGATDRLSPALAPLLPAEKATRLDQLLAATSAIDFVFPEAGGWCFP